VILKQKTAYEIETCLEFRLSLFRSGLQVEFINLPFGGQLEFGFLSVLITVLWILGITNAINFIDGLDGLAAGISAIALLSIAVLAIVMGIVYVLTVSMILFWRMIGFLRFTLHSVR